MNRGYEKFFEEKKFRWLDVCSKLFNLLVIIEMLMKIIMKYFFLFLKFYFGRLFKLFLKILFIKRY